MRRLQEDTHGPMAHGPMGHGTICFGIKRHAVGAEAQLDSNFILDGISPRSGMNMDSLANLRRPGRAFPVIPGT
eukprot:97329-Pyramimonas_sp.AAC.1